MSNPEEVLAALAEAESAGDQLDLIRKAWGSAGIVELSMDEAAAILKRLGEACSRSEQLAVLTRGSEERLLSCAFDVAVGPLIMSQPQLRLLLKLVHHGVASHTHPRTVARALDALETGCFMSAAQATQLMSAATAAEPASGSRINEWWHVVCARVLDKWNLKEAEHSQIACYYGWDCAYLSRVLRHVSFVSDGGQTCSAASLTAAELQARVLGEQSAAEQGNPPEMSRQLQNRVLSHMGKADHLSYSHSSCVRSYAAQLIARNLCSGSSDTCAICLDPCQNGCALWTCKRCQNHLHSTCHREWAKKKTEDDADEEVPCPYCRSTEN